MMIDKQREFHHCCETFYNTRHCVEERNGRFIFDPDQNIGTFQVNYCPWCGEKSMVMPEVPYKKDIK